MEVILGSSSPRRKKFLETLIKNFKIIKPHVDEKSYKNELPVDFAKRISSEKSKYILTNNTIDEYPLIIISSDTIVTIDGLILGKPSNSEDAFRILSILNGREHHVLTAISIIFCQDSSLQNCKSITDYERTSVNFKNLSTQDITDYMDMIDYMDKAGAYAFQEHGEMIIDFIEGSVSNIIGFPLRLFYRMLNTIGAIDCFFEIK